MHSISSSSFFWKNFFWLKYIQLVEEVFDGLFFFFFFFGGFGYPCYGIHIEDGRAQVDGLEKKWMKYI